MRFSNNNDIWGYNIATNSNKYVRQIAQSVRFIDKSFILENYDKNIKSACSNQDFQTSKISDITLRLERSKLIGTVE
jgi:hypothetical protein